MKLFIFKLIYIFFLIKTCIGQEFQKSIAMHGTTNRPNEIERDINVNKNAPFAKILKLAHIGTFNSLNPYIIKGISPPGIKGLVIESLMHWSPDEPFSLYPGIAEGVKVDKNRKWVTFKINKNAKFSNGKNITSKDVEFSLNILKNHGRPHTRSYYSLVKMIEIRSPNIIKFYFSKESNYEMPLIIGLMPVFSKKYWINKKFDNTTLEPFISSGPYIIDKILPGRSIIYKKNTEWWNQDSPDSQGRYNFEFIKYDFYRDNNIALEAFLSGEFDIYIETNAIRWDQKYKNSKVIKKTFKTLSPSGIEAIIFNARIPPFNNRNIRKALSLLFPNKFINRVLNHNLLQPTSGPWDNSELSATLKASNISKNILKKYDDYISKEAILDLNLNRDDERTKIKNAIKLLNKNGWKIKNGKMIKNKKILEFEVITNQSNMKRLLLIWKDKLKKIGVDIRIRVLDSSEFQNRINTFNFDAIIFKYYMSLSPGNEQSIYWGSWAANKNGSRNYSGISHPAIDETINKITNAKNRNNLIEYTRTLDRILRIGSWMIPLFHDPYHRIAHQEYISIPKKIPLYGFNAWTAWKK